MIGDTDVLCMRLRSGRACKLSDGQVGYLHPIPGAKRRGGPFKRREKPPEKDTSSVKREYERLAERSSKESLVPLASATGVNVDSLWMMGAVSTARRDVFAFPMYSFDRVVIGIRYRANDGQKWSQIGSRNGLFLPLPQFPPDGKTVMICEGATDAAAAAGMDYFPVGRFSVSGGATAIIDFMRRYNIYRTIIVADNDEERMVGDRMVSVGIEGAVRLAELLPGRRCVLALPTKDLRGFVNQGGERSDIEHLVSQLRWMK